MDIYSVIYHSGKKVLYADVKSIVDRGEEFYLFGEDKKIIAIINKRFYESISKA